MTRQHYDNPPVHEVVLDVRFEGAVPPDVLGSLPASLSADLGTAAPLTGFSIQGGVAPTGPTPFQVKLEALGWEFRRDAPIWILRAQSERLTLHAVRSQVWPRGEYIGWERIAAEWKRVLGVVTAVYGSIPIRRVGLRYVNRIGVPAGADLKNLFQRLPTEFGAVRGLYEFTSNASWAEVTGHPGFSATVRLGSIGMPEIEEAAGRVGVLLDLDVFNLYVSDGPAWPAVLDWFEEAHAIENDLFELSVTDELRASFALSQGER